MNDNETDREVTMYEVTSSVTNTFWHIVRNGKVTHGAPKRGHGRATKAMMQAWANDLNRGTK